MRRTGTVMHPEKHGKTVWLLGLLSAATFVTAGVMSLKLGSAAYIVDREDEHSRGRLLIETPIPNQVMNTRIDLAMLEFPSLRLPDSIPEITFDVRQVTTSWSPRSVTWQSPWRNTGGDFVEASALPYMLVSGDTLPIRINVTQYVRAWQAGAGNFGLILMRPTDEGGGFRGESALLRDAIGSARLKLHYIRVQR